MFFVAFLFVLAVGYSNGETWDKSPVKIAQYPLNFNKTIATFGELPEIKINLKVLKGNYELPNKIENRTFYSVFKSENGCYLLWTAPRNVRNDSLKFNVTSNVNGSYIDIHLIFNFNGVDKPRTDFEGYYLFYWVNATRQPVQQPKLVKLDITGGSLDNNNCKTNINCKSDRCDLKPNEKTGICLCSSVNDVRIGDECLEVLKLHDPCTNDDRCPKNSHCIKNACECDNENVTVFTDQNGFRKCLKQDKWWGENCTEYYECIQNKLPIHNPVCRKDNETSPFMCLCAHDKMPGRDNKCWPVDKCIDGGYQNCRQFDNAKCLNSTCVCERPEKMNRSSLALIPCSSVNQVNIQFTLLLFFVFFALKFF